jgi:hypothetical protein
MVTSSGRGGEGLVCARVWVRGAGGNDERRWIVGGVRLFSLRLNFLESLEAKGNRTMSMEVVGRDKTELTRVWEE